MTLLRDLTFLATLIKKAALDVVNEMDLTGIRYGIVTSASPLKVTVDQKLVLTEKLLVLTRNVKDFEFEMSVNDGEKQVYKVFNGLKMNDQVTLLKAQGGQQYIVLDKE